METTQKAFNSLKKARKQTNKRTSFTTNNNNKTNKKKQQKWMKFLNKCQPQFLKSTVGIQTTYLVCNKHFVL